MGFGQADRAGPRVRFWMAFDVTTARIDPLWAIASTEGR
jgi:hypothetical protein